MSFTGISGTFKKTATLEELPVTLHYLEIGDTAGSLIFNFACLRVSYHSS